MYWLLISEIGYLIILVAVCIRIVYDTSNTTKSLAYLLLAIFVPVPTWKKRSFFRQLLEKIARLVSPLL